MEFPPTVAKTSAGGRPSKECLLTLETAKRVSMSEGGLIGTLVRSYYLWTEGIVIEATEASAAPP